MNTFLANAGSSLAHFRYYNSRNLNVIANHIVTLLGYENENPVAYGHLDIENDTIWLGVCVIESEKGKGYGSQIMKYLLNYAKDNDIKEIHLSVDFHNLAANYLYQKLGFELYKQDYDVSYYVWKGTHV